LIGKSKAAAMFVIRTILGEIVKVGFIRLAVILLTAGGLWYADEQGDRTLIRDTRQELHEKVTILEHELAWQIIRIRSLQRQLEKEE